MAKIALSKGIEAALPFATFVLVFTPIQSRVSVGFFELTTQRLVLITLVCLYFLAEKGVGQVVENLKMPLKWLILIHIAWCVISTMNSIAPLMSVKKLLSVVFEYYALYFVYWKSISKRQTINRILLAMVIAMLACSVFGTVEAYCGWNVTQLFPSVESHFAAGAFEEVSERGVRVQSTFDHPILLGTALAMAITLTLYLLDYVKNSKEKLVLWGALGLMFLNLYKTGSRGPWLDAILGCVLLFIFGQSQLRWRVLIIGVLSVTAMIVRPGIWETIEGIYWNTMDTNTVEGSSYEYRYALQRAALKKVQQDPSRELWGYGFESFYMLGIEGDFLGERHKFLSADDSWAELMVETGFVGLGTIALLLLTPAWMAWKDFRNLPRPDRYLSLVLFVNMVLFYFQMSSVGMYSWGQNGYMLWIIISLAVAQRTLRKFEEPGSQTSTSVGGCPVLPA